MNDMQNEVVTGGHEEEPSMDAGLLILTGPLVAGAKYLYDARKDTLAQVKPSEPLRFAVLDVQRRNGVYLFTLMCRNFGGHGVYLETFEAKDPVAAKTTASILRRSGTFYQPPIGHGSPADVPVLPVLLPGGEAVCIQVELEGVDAARLKKKPYGKLSVSYTVLGVNESGLTASIAYSIPPWLIT